MSHSSSLILEIAEVAGDAASIQLLRARGGERVFIPKTTHPDHWLVQAVGTDAAAKIAYAFGGDFLVLPTDPSRGLKAQQIAAAEAIQRGLSINEAARVSGFSRRAIEKRKARLRGHNGKAVADLFGK